MSLEELTAQLNSLKAIVEKQSQVIAQTGQQVLDIQVKNVRSKMDDFDVNKKSSSNIDVDDFVTNEDIVQLVGELQGQLDFLEDRSIKRLFNSALDENSTNIIAPLSNRDGEEPSGELYPKTVQQFLDLDASSLVLLCEFYELVQSNEPVDLENAENLEEAQKQLSETRPLNERVESLTPGQLDELKDELARYMGLKFRAQEGVW
ncbi:uncharacterized protein Mrp8p [[Candida] railenensis]|uniref:Uncharacterized protein Mrp8p n=1 Tax=[Candida] railenensis TaxID=45579 RepID=A0A9P0QPQ4_9ASCO|nr:uncharacterized protein Mrp8p [[Candida] railenensis]